MPIKIYFEDESRMVSDEEDFFKQFTIVTAAGGLVLNDAGKILMIFRRNKWDLPKGKLEQGESLEICADREVREETGLSQLVMERFLLTTYHTYTERGKSILKDTHWFLFKAPGVQSVHPQTEEEISEIVWVSKENMNQYTSNTYQLIVDVLKTAEVTI